MKGLSKRQHSKLIRANGGKIRYSAVNELVKQYQSNGYKAVTQQTLYYRLERNKKLIVMIA